MNINEGFSGFPLATFDFQRLFDAMKPIHHQQAMSKGALNQLNQPHLSGQKLINGYKWPEY
jgi:hypothetical protein